MQAARRHVPRQGTGPEGHCSRHQTQFWPWARGADGSLRGQTEAGQCGTNKSGQRSSLRNIAGLLPTLIVFKTHEAISITVSHFKENLSCTPFFFCLFVCFFSPAEIRSMHVN